MRPRAPSFENTSRGNSCFSSHSRACGASSDSANSRTVFWRSCCSSLRPKSKSNPPTNHPTKRRSMVSDRGRAFYYGRMRRLFLGVLLVVLLYAGWTAAGLPSRAEVRALARTNPTVTSLMRQREAEARRAGRPFRRVQSWVPISSVSRHLIHAVIASEDQRFFGHEGVDWDAIKKSVDADRAQGRFVRGGSTITQQLAKNLFFTTEKSITRKVRELVAARWLEGDLSKKRILELYLNVIEWGDGVYGAEAAAQHYYGKPASALGPEEAAGLAGMIPNPRRINPLVDARRFARAERRALWLMASAGYIERDAAGLGAEPPPVEADDEPEPPVAPTAAPATPSPIPEETPVPAATPEVTSTPPATVAPEATPTPEVTPTPDATPTPGPEA